MTRGIKVRLVAFVILSAVGLLYVGGSYLGFVDQILGRDYTVHVTLPDSGGLYQGSEVTYRGVNIGKVTKMTVERDGLRVDARLKEGSRVPANSPVFVHNLSAVGEQYLSFEPKSKQGPMLKNGDIVHGTKASLPLGEDELMRDLSRFISSVSGPQLNTVVTELGAMFKGNATPLRSLIDDAQVFIAAARSNESDTIDLFREAKTVLQTQQDNAVNIRSFARDLNSLTGTLATSDGDIRAILKQAGPSADELSLLVGDLRSKLPPLLTHLVNISDMLDARLPALEQLLVTFPRLAAAGPSALAPGQQKFGRVNLNMNQSPAACTDGYLPPGQWRPTSEEKPAESPPLSSAHSFEPYFPAACNSGPPLNMRGMKYAPAPLDKKSQTNGGNR